MAAGSARHVPVLLQDAIHFLNVRTGGTYADATLGAAGHSAAIARKLGPGGHLIGFDRDPDALELARTRLETLAGQLGAEMPQWTLSGKKFPPLSRQFPEASLDGLLADFGLSSMQVDTAHR